MRQRIGQSSRAMNLAQRLSGRLNQTPYANVEPSQRHATPLLLSGGRPSTKIWGLPRVNITVPDVDCDVESVASSRGRSSYATQFQRPPSDDHFSSYSDNGYAHYLNGSNHYYARHLNVINDDGAGDGGYARRLYDDDDRISAISPFQFRPGRFNGITADYRNQFGRGPSTLLTGDANRDRSGTDEVQWCAIDSGNGNTHHLSRDDGLLSSVCSLQQPPIRFFPRRSNVSFGRTPSTLLSGRHGFLASDIAVTEARTHVRDRSGEVGS